MDGRKFYVNASKTGALEGIMIMKLKEIEMDLPYIKNDEFIHQLQENKGLNYQDAVRKDYEINWKGIRREFQLMTRCMTSMIERIMSPINTPDCWKIVLECVDECKDNNYKNLLGVYIIQIPFDIRKFFQLTNLEKKKMVIENIIEGVYKLSDQVSFEIDSIYEACEKIKNYEYVNEWMWGKKLKIGDKYAQIKVEHEVDNVGIYAVFYDKKNTIIKKSLIIDAIPDERAYGIYLGKLEQYSQNEVILITKTGEKFIQNCNV